MQHFSTTMCITSQRRPAAVNSAAAPPPRPTISTSAGQAPACTHAAPCLNQPQIPPAHTSHRPQTAPAALRLRRQIRRQKHIDIPVKYAAVVRSLRAGAQVFNHLVRLQNVRPYLIPPAVVALLFPFLLRRCLFLMQFDFIQLWQSLKGQFLWKSWTD